MPRNSRGIEIAEIYPDQCIGCQVCIGECPVGAIQLSEAGVAVIDPSVCIGCGKCSEVCPVGAAHIEKKRRQQVSDQLRGPVSNEWFGYKDIAVFIETLDKETARVSRELIGKGRELAQRRGVKLLGFILGSGMADITEEILTLGCDDLHVIDHPVLKDYHPASYGKALRDLTELIKPEILLIGATALGRDLSGVVAAKLNTGLTADCTALAIDEVKGSLLMTRPTFGGNIMATIDCEFHRPQMSTVRPGIMKIKPAIPNIRSAVFMHAWDPPPGSLPEIVEFIPDHKNDPDIARAPALVVAGKGACDPGSLPMLQELADLLGGMIACSRPVVESGLMPYERQVGQTGKAVAPQLYVGIGVSGAIQHLVGIQGADRIVAINSDPEAPLFRVADAGLVGNYLDIVPALIVALKKRKNIS
jgi:electron transfer flavoprotein alpha subunit